MKIVFLDRDGVINRYPGDKNYVTKVKDLHVFPSAVSGIRALTDNGFTVFVISNQAGVGRGVYTQDKLDRITAKMHKKVNAGGGRIAGVFYCTHHPESGCDCRKPGIGLIKQALRFARKPLGFAKQTYFIGDTDKDIQAGATAGCTTMLVLTGRDQKRSVSRWDVKPDHIVKDLNEAVQVIQHEDPSHSRHRRGRA